MNDTNRPSDQRPYENRRSEHRLSFQGAIRGRLRHDEEELDFAPFDISKKGLGLYLKPCPPTGETLSLELEGRKTLKFTIKHIYGEREGMKRCGIELIPNANQDLDLIEIISQY